MGSSFEKHQKRRLISSYFSVVLSISLVLFLLGALGILVVNTKLISNEFKEKVIKTFIHGYLHLLGFDHVKNKDYRIMLDEEEKIYKSVISKIN